MHRVAFFVEDSAHRQVIGALVRRIAAELGVEVHLEWYNATGGYGKVVSEFKTYLRDIQRQGTLPDLIVVATDANCQGLNERIKEVGGQDAPVSIVHAIPDPHIERWLLLDGAAFKSVFGAGCPAPDHKCERNRYKELLVESIRDTGTIPPLGGMEYAQDIVREMDIERAAREDRSLGRFVKSLRAIFKEWARL